MIKAGPNDARHVVWALRYVFFTFDCVFSMLTNDFIIFRFLLCFMNMWRVWMGNDNQSRPKRRQTRRLGFWYAFFFFNFFTFLYFN